MAALTITFTIGADSYTKTITASDARAVEFLDDLRNYYYDQVDDGAGGLRVLTRQEVGAKYINELSADQNRLATEVKQRKIFITANTADSLGS